MPGKFFYKSTISAIINAMDMTWVEIDLSAILHNIKEIRRRLNKGVKICAVIKDNAYGHGIVELAKVLENGGVEFLGVGDVSEAALLRKNGVKIPILNILSALPSQVKEVVKWNISQNVSDLAIVRLLDAAAKKQKKIASVHIEIDTGMGRLGIPAGEFEDFLVKMNKFKNIKVEGVFTHLACADSNTEYTLKQISDFEYNTFLAPEGMIKHILNSDGVANFPGAAFDMVRPGIMLYGIYGNKKERKTVKLKPALSWKTKVLSVKNFKKGSCISYGSTYRTKKNTKIAVLGAGYNCGYNRQLSNIGEVLINGKKYPVAGRICMDLTMVDLGASSKVKTGDVAVFIGKSGKKYIGAEELAEKCKTVPYDIIGAIKNNITRVFV